jgi:CheY-like chemotaxis protein
VRILIVEDEPRLRDLIGRSLIREGYEVDSAADGAEGFEKAKSGGFDVIVLDVMLPTMSGLEISMRLRRQGVDVPILMLTARDAVDDRVGGARRGSGRLPRQALRLRRAQREAARAHPAQGGRGGHLDPGRGCRARSRPP